MPAPPVLHRFLWLGPLRPQRIVSLTDLDERARSVPRRRVALLGCETFLLEEVLLVASFSGSGAAQFSRDCDALLSVFRPFAPRCDRHVKARSVRVREPRSLAAT